MRAATRMMCWSRRNTRRLSKVKNEDRAERQGQDGQEHEYALRVAHGKIGGRNDPHDEHQANGIPRGFLDGKLP
jgi:hypothetical protein